MSNRVAMTIIGAMAVLLILAFIQLTDLPVYLRTQVALPIAPAQQADFTWNAPADTIPGDYAVTATVQDATGAQVTQDIAITLQAAGSSTGDPGNQLPIIPAQPSEQPPAGDTTTNEAPKEVSQPEVNQREESSGSEAPALATSTFQAEKGKVVGVTAYSGVEPTGRTVVLAQPKARLEIKVNVPSGDYALQVKAKDDLPGPAHVNLVVYLNGKAWKSIKLGGKNKPDNQYHEYTIGTLRDFSTSTISYRFINDQYNPKAAPDTWADQDRNLHIDWMRLQPN